MLQTKSPRVSVIVPCRNEDGHIEHFIGSIFRQRFGDFEVIIADGASDDGTREKLDQVQERDSRFVIIDNPDRYVSKGLNLAIGMARGEIVVRMDVHTEYADDYLDQCIDALEKTGADNVGGPARTHAEGYLQKAISIAYHSPFAVGGARFHDVDYEGYVDTVTYGCWYRKKLIEIGLFDEELVRNQDDELNLRMTRAGGRIWQTPKIRSWYYPRASLAALFRQYMQYGYWKIRVIQKHRLPASFRHLVPGLFVGALVVLLLLSPLWELPRLLLGTLLATYVMASVGASLRACQQANFWRCFPIMPIVFAMYHFGYGVGFLRGLIDFVLFKRSSGRFTTLTRKSKP